jgi:hypothetical protein
MKFMIEKSDSLTTPNVSASNECDFDITKVPDDFPYAAQSGAVGGAQLKFLGVQYEGKFYSSGNTPPERYDRWDYCEDLAAQFVVKCRNNEHGKYSHLTQSEILGQYCERLISSGYGSTAEMRWLIRRTAALLQWPVPASAEEPLS